MKKRILSLFLTGMMVFSSVPVYAESDQAVEESAYEDVDDGSEELAFSDGFQDAQSLEENDWTQGESGETSVEETEDTDDTEDLFFGDAQFLEDETTSSEENADSQEEQIILSSGNLKSGVNWKLLKDGKLQLSGSGIVEKDEESDYPWEKEKVLSLEIEEGITAIGSGAFTDCINLTNVLIDADTLSTVSEDAFLNCSKAKVELFYSGNAPTAIPAFTGTGALTVYYQEINSTWTEEFRAGYASVKWVSCCKVYDLNKIVDHTYVRDSNVVQVQTDGNNYPTPENMAYYNTTCSECGKKNREYNECMHCIDTTDIQSDHPYSTETTSEWTVSMEGAKEIILIFDGQTKFETNYDDFFYIYDENGEVYQKYINDQLAGKTVVVPGSSVTLKLTTDYSTDEWGFAVTKAFGTTHEWSSTVTKPAEKDQTGILTRTCQKCGESVEEVIPAPYLVCGIDNQVFWGITPEHVLEIAPEQADRSGVQVGGYYSTTTINGHEVTTAPWGKYENYIEGLRIKKGIAYIMEYAFYGLSKLKWVEMEEGVESISNRVFAYCSSLERVDLADSVERIGLAAFAYCNSLKSFTFPKNLISCAFAFGSTPISSVNIKNLSGWLKMSQYPEFQDALEIDYYLNGEPLENLVIPSGVTKIRARAFEKGRNIKTVTFPENIEAIDESAFSGCKNLELTVDKLPNYLKSIGDSAFYGCEKISKVAIPSSVVRIGSNAFSECGRLTEAVFTKDIQIEEIPNYMFSGCENLKKISIPSSVKSIGDGAFSGCTALENFKIPATVTSIGGRAFGDGVKKVTFLGDYIDLSSGFSMDQSVKVSYYACNDTWNSAQAQEFFGNTQYKITPNPVHMTEGEVTVTLATCTTDGERTFVCDNCKETVTEVIPSTGHTLTLADHKDPTCVAKGYDIEVCSVCKEQFTTELEIDPAAHQYDEGKVVEANCSRGGYTLYTCKLCGNVKRENYVPATAHDYEDTVVKPTCQTMGYTRHQCKNCDYFYDDTWTEALEHEYEETVTAPTCTERGYTYYSCKNCGYSYTDHYVGATGHQYEKEVIQPTCTEKGYTKNTCSVCGLSYISNYKEATGHDCDVAVKAPTCTEKGYTTYSCKNCDYVFVTDYRSALGHSYQAEITESTCTKEGFITYTCVTCGNSYVGEKTNTAPHQWEEGIVTKEPTYLEKGTRTYQCANCDASYTEDIPALEQTALSDCTITLSYQKTTYDGKEKTPKVTIKNNNGLVNAEDYTVTYADNENAGEATVTITAKEGNVSVTGTANRTFTIAKAGQTVTAQMAAESIHVDTSEPVTVNGLGTIILTSENPEIAEVTEDGLILGKKKGTTYLTIQAAGDDNHEAAQTKLQIFVNEDHLLKVTETVAPTCKTPGKVTSVCEFCGKTITEEKEIDLIHGHDYETTVVASTCTSAGYTKHTCSICGDVYTDDYLAATGHDYEVTVTEPTCTEAGYKTYTCKTCKETKTTDYKKATGHSYKKEVTAPTCTEKGYTTYTCTVCDDTYVDDYREPLNHDFKKVVTPSTCTKEGFTTYTCTRCGNSYTGEETEKASHKWDNGTVTKEATYLEKGTRTYQCTNCDASYTEDIPALEQTALSDCTITLSYQKTTYDGKEKTPKVTIKNNNGLVNAEDYTVTYADNENAGEATVTITAKEGNVSVTGTANRTFTIAKAGQTVTAQMAAESIHVDTSEPVTVNGLGTIILTSENPEIVEVTEDGMILGKKKGTTYLTIQAAGDDNHEAAETKLQIFVNEEHIFEITQTVASTCSTPGSITSTCTLCGKIVTKEQELNLISGHDYTVEKTAPTCVEMGYTTYTCKNCGKTKITDYVNATGHTYDAKVTKSTCTEKGYTTYTCTVCGDTYTDDYREPLNHIYKKQVTPSSCTEKGFTTYICKRCGNSYVGEETDVTPHHWDNGTVTQKANYQENGTKTFKCLECGNTYTKDIPALEKTDLSECQVTLSYQKTTYNGKAKTPEVQVKTDSGVVSEDAYTVAYADNQNAGTAKVIVTAKDGNVEIKGSSTLLFTITKAKQSFLAYTAEERIHANVEVPILISGGVGTASFTTKDTDLIDLKGSKIVGKRAGLALVQVTVSGDANHEAATSTAAVWIDENHLITKNVENKRTLSNGDVEYDDVQKCSVCGYVSKKEHKLLKNLNTQACEIRLSSSVYVLDGQAIKPAVSVYLSGKALKEGTDYRVEYKNNDRAGNASVSVVGIGGYTNSKATTFQILKALEPPSVTSLENTSKGIKVTWKRTEGVQGYILYRATGKGAFKEIKTITGPAVTAYEDTTAKKNGEKYTYAVCGYNGNVKSSYTGKVTYRLSTTGISSIKNNAAKKLTVKWKKNAKATGYQVNYKTGSKQKTVTIKSNKTLSTVLKSLKKGATYSVKVRGYKKVSGVTYYSKWSAVKKVKIKK